MSGMTATEVRSRLDHPVIDIDGHTVEFFPALAGELVKEGVRLDGESMLRRTSGTFGPIVDWYGLTPEQRAEQRVARGPWGNGGMELALDRATAMLPRLLHERLPELGIDVSVIYPSFGLAVRPLRRRARPPGRVPRAQPLQRRRLRRVLRPPAPRRRDPHAHARRSGRRARARGLARVPRRGDGRLRATTGRSGGGRRPGARAVRGVDRHVRPRQRLRLRPGVAEVPRARHRARVPLVGHGLAEPGVDLELRVQPRRHARREPPRAGEVAVPRRRHPPLPRPQLRVPRGRGRVGGVALRRSRRALREAQRRGDARASTPPTSTGTSSPTSSPATAATGRTWRRSPRPIPSRTWRSSTSSPPSASTTPRRSATCSRRRSSAGARPTTR